MAGESFPSSVSGHIILGGEVKMVKRYAGIYSIIVGISMIAMWIMFYVTGSIPELATEPARILLHIIAEFVTAVALLTGGWGLLTLKAWGYQVYMLATGALVYTVIQSSGYFIDNGELGLVCMFAVLLVLTILLLTKMMKTQTV
jgi:hypothetical protein